MQQSHPLEVLQCIDLNLVLILLVTSQPHRPVLKQARNTNIPLTLNFAEPQN